MRIDSLIKGISQIAIVVPSLGELGSWTKLFNSGIQTYTSEEQGVKALVIKTEMCDIEFLEPLDKQSSISSFLEKNPKGGIHHICFFVDELEESLKILKEEGIRSITRGKTLGLIHRTPVAFLNPKDLSNVLIELEELPKEIRK